MGDTTGYLVLENRHTGERLALQRYVDAAGVTCLRLRGSLPPGRQGPPLHVHHGQDEEGEVLAGTLSAEVDGVVSRFRPGEHVSLPAGRPHRWWNEGEEPLAFEGIARPALDLDRYLQAVFAAMNASADGRPSPFHMAHIAWRHRRTQAIAGVPAVVTAVALPALRLLGTLLGRYRGAAWPGAPETCVEAPMAEAAAPGTAARA